MIAGVIVVAILTAIDMTLNITSIECEWENFLKKFSKTGQKRENLLYI